MECIYTHKYNVHCTSWSLVCMQFVLLMGMNNATSLYCCLWCIVRADERWVAAKSNQWNGTLYNCTRVLHTDGIYPIVKRPAIPLFLKKEVELSSLPINSTLWSKGCRRHKGSIHEPLIPLEPSQLVMDELHLLLKVSNVLLRNLIFQADGMKQRSREREGTECTILQTLQDMIASCRVSFEIRQVKL